MLYKIVRKVGFWYGAYIAAVAYVAVRVAIGLYTAS